NFAPVISPVTRFAVKKLRQLCILILAFSPSVLFGGVRHFTFLYEAPTSARGSLELENWVTWQRITGPSRSDEVDFRHELEYGVTDKFQVSIYLADWFYENNRGGGGVTYSHSALEFTYNRTNPVHAPLGNTVFGKLKRGASVNVMETKLMTQKNYG